MLDPFPPPPAWLETFSAPVAAFFNLPTLPLHAHEVLASALFYYVLHTVVAPALSKALIPTIYANFNTRTKINWNVHFVSFVQSVVVSSFALWSIWADEERSSLDWRGRVWGYTGATGVVQALAAGYFLWDLYMCMRYVNIFGVGMLAHGISALSVYSLGFRPFVNYYAPIFILYELSSPFLNIHWALDKLNLTGSRYQLINGILLITVFFCARLVWGTYQSVRCFSDVWMALREPGTQIVIAPPPFTDTPATVPSTDETAEVMRFAGEAVVPLWLAATYLSSNLVLNSLNWYWFSKMIDTIRKRFEPGAKKVAHEKALANGTANGTATGQQADGELRKRKA